MSGNTVSPISLVSFPNAIVHVDGDAFFTSVEQAVNPELKGKPVVTGKERGIVACASYEAKALGIRRPMRLFDTQKMCPNLICLPSDYEAYSLYSKRMCHIIQRFTPAVEEYSIDEMFAEISGLRRIYRTGYPEIARRIKETIEKELGIVVSVGLSASKTLAKLASQHEKPNGFTVVRANELHHFLKNIPLEKVCGFGPNTVALLRKHGLKTVLDYVMRPETWAKQMLGKIGIELWHELRGDWVYPVNPEEKTEYASISKCKTFTPPSSNLDFIKAQLLRNLESAFIKLRRHHFRAKGIAIYFRDREFRTSGVEAELERSTSSIMEAAPLVQELFEKLYRPNKLYRLTGVVLFKLEADGEVQYSLFDDLPKIKSLKEIDHVIDRANELYGKHSLHLGSGLWLGKYSQHISERGDVPKRKKELMPGETARQRLHLPMWQLKI